MDRLFKHFKKSEIFTIPNILTYIRIILIPIFLYLYCIEKAYIAAVIVAVITSISDFLDGFIARKFNMISDIGKMLDPIADKLMQAAFIIALYSVYSSAILLFGVMFVKELILAIVAYRVVKYTYKITCSKWYCRYASVILDATMAILLLWNDIPHRVANLIFAVDGALMIFSLLMYTAYYEGIIKSEKNKNGLNRPTE